VVASLCFGISDDCLVSVELKIEEIGSCREISENVYPQMSSGSRFVEQKSHRETP
jgi:hypothetical protein